MCFSRPGVFWIFVLIGVDVDDVCGCVMFVMLFRACEWQCFHGVCICFQRAELEDLVYDCLCSLPWHSLGWAVSVVQCCFVKLLLRLFMYVVGNGFFEILWFGIAIHGYDMSLHSNLATTLLI